jgi:putative hydrolase of the HAD superfamily
MVAHLFDHVAFWVFDLDNTLYPPAARLFDQIEVRMTDWVMEALKVDRAEADRLRSHYWRTYGTTLAGSWPNTASIRGPISPMCTRSTSRISSPT